MVEKMRGEQLEILKRDASGDILATEIALNGRPINVIVKRPWNKYRYRRILQLVRASRAKRLFERTRSLLARRIDVEYPLIVMERRVLGYAVESVAIFERVPGHTLEHTDLDALTAVQRENLFRACGRVLRRIEDTGLAHPDAKSSNWIVFEAVPDERGNRSRSGPKPVLIDAYGVRPLTATLQLRGLTRLLRAMKHHPQYTRVDSLHLCLGFSPRTMPTDEPEGTR
jgi:tRNA A-37 threonylcarbamoyl transferase component Bud32